MKALWAPQHLPLLEQLVESGTASCFQCVCFPQQKKKKKTCPGMPQGGFQFLRLSAYYSPTGNHDVTQKPSFSRSGGRSYKSVSPWEPKCIEPGGCSPCRKEGEGGLLSHRYLAQWLTDGCICSGIFSGSRGITELSSSYYLSLIVWEDLLVLCSPLCWGTESNGDGNRHQETRTLD